jgi:hypothetical protein
MDIVTQIQSLLLIYFQNFIQHISNLFFWTAVH